MHQATDALRSSAHPIDLTTLRVSAVKLTTTDHRSDSAGLTYIYPVISRRMGGLSIGINFNTNNACNWRCIYCQVPDLKIGAAPKIELELLEQELRAFLIDVKEGDFYDRYNVDTDKRIIKDIAIAGNGEPTSLKDFASAVELIGKIATEAGIFPDSSYVLITNGSLIHQTNVQAGLSALKAYGGEVWFKFDSATEEGRALTNHASQSSKTSLNNLLLSASLCPTKLQICLVDYDQQGFSNKERLAFIDLFKTLKQLDCQLEDILLYTIARPSLQPEATKIRPLDTAILNDFAAEIRLLDYKVSVTA